MFLCRLQSYLYAISIILHILFLHNCTKTHTLLFLSFLLSIDLNRLVFGTWVFAGFFFFISIAKYIISKSFSCMMVCFWHEVIPSWIGYYELNITIISNIFHIFFGNLFIYLTKYFLKLFLAFFSSTVFISVYVFSQTFWMSLMNLCTFFLN